MRLCAEGALLIKRYPSPLAEIAANIARDRQSFLDAAARTARDQEAFAAAARSLLHLATAACSPTAQQLLGSTSTFALAATMARNQQTLADAAAKVAQPDPRSLIELPALAESPPALREITPLPDALAERLAPLIERLAERPEPPTPKRRQRRAGEREWAWSDAMHAVCKELRREGFKPTGARGEQAEIARRLAKWFLDQVDDHPSDSRLRDYAEALLGALAATE
jgi:hypothetical protein